MGFNSGFKGLIKYEILWKSVQWEPSCSMQIDGQTDRHNEAIVAFPSLAIAPKNQIKQFWTVKVSFRDRQLLNYVGYVSYGFPQGKNFLKATSDYIYLNFKRCLLHEI